MNLFPLYTNNTRIPQVSSNATILANRYSFRLVRRAPVLRAKGEVIHSRVEVPPVEPFPPTAVEPQTAPEIVRVQGVDDGKRSFLKLASVVGLGVVAASALPQKAQAYVMGSAPTSSVVGVKNASNVRVNPATQETLQVLVEGNSVLKKTISLSGSGTVHTPASGKKVRIYNTKFSLDATMTSVSFRFTSGGTDFEKYVAPRTGGLYGTNNHPNYKEGGVDEVVYCSISGTGNVQINIDYLEV